MKERLELVRDFAELRAGMIVVTDFCEFCCAGRHRAILVNYEVARCDGIAQSLWNALPNPHWTPYFCVTNRNVEDRKVWRVVDPGLENTADITAAHKIPATKKKRERA